MSRSQPRLEPDTQFDSDGSREPVALLNVERDLVKFGMQSFYKGSIRYVLMVNTLQLTAASVHCQDAP